MNLLSTTWTRKHNTVCSRTVCGFSQETLFLVRSCLKTTNQEAQVGLHLDWDRCFASPSQVLSHETWGVLVACLGQGLIFLKEFILFNFVCECMWMCVCWCSCLCVLRSLRPCQIPQSFLQVSVIPEPVTQMTWSELWSSNLCSKHS